MIFFVVDTDMSELHSLRKNLKEVYEDAEVILHNDPTTAIRKAMIAKPDCFITDARLGNRDGISLAKQIRQMLPTASVIIMSDSEQYGVDAWKIHAKGYLLKPITAEKIKKYLN